MLSKCEGYPSRAVMAQYNASMCPTGMTLALGGVHPPPCPHATLAPCGMRARWGRGGGHAPPRASVMPVGHMDALRCPHPMWGEGGVGAWGWTCPTQAQCHAGGAHRCVHPHAALAPHGMRARWGCGGGRAPPRPSVMPVGHMDVPHPHAAWAFWVGRSSWAAYIICTLR